jgi:hypothetical protein
VNSREIPECPGETWARVEQALYRGYRGLAGGSSLARLLGEVRRGPKAGRRSSRGGKGNREGRT